MILKRLPAKNHCRYPHCVGFIHLCSLKYKSTTDDIHSSWKDYWGGPDHRLIADGNTAIIYIFIHEFYKLIDKTLT